MINGIEGIPGSGKSYEAVVYHVLAALKEGRLVVTNLPLIVEMFAAMDSSYRYLIEVRKTPAPVRGTWDANREDSAFELFADGRCEAPGRKVAVFGHVWDYYHTWRHPSTGHGPLFVIDECHVSLPSIGTDSQVHEYYKLHRHFNVDVLLMTQSFRDIDQPIARLMGILVKCRKADIMGRPKSYIRKVHAGYRGAVISTEERKYQPQFFGLYRSHTQGNAIAEKPAGDMTPFLVQFNRVKWVVVAFGVVFAAWAFFPKEKAQSVAKNPPAWLVEAEQERKAGRSAAAMITPVQVPPGANAQNDVQPVAEDEMPEPFGFKGVHLTGRVKMRGRVLYTFALSNNAVFVNSVTSDELESMGYKWEPLTDCAGALHWKKKVRAVICDAPKTTGETAQA